jgi:hypothetical protein
MRVDAEKEKADAADQTFISSRYIFSLQTGKEARTHTWAIINVYIGMDRQQGVSCSK